MPSWVRHEKPRLPFSGPSGVLIIARTARVSKVGECGRGPDPERSGRRRQV
jgi:hypothetical protein